MRNRFYFLSLLAFSLLWANGPFKPAPRKPFPPAILVPISATEPAPRTPPPPTPAPTTLSFADDPGNPALLAEVRSAIEQSHDLPKMEALIRKALSNRPEYVEMNELIGDIYVQEGRLEEALDHYGISETSENDFSLAPKLLQLYAELGREEERDLYLARLDKTIVERVTWKNRSPEEIRQRGEAAFSLCRTRSLRAWKATEEEETALATFSRCKKHFSQADPTFRNTYESSTPDLASWVQ